MTSYANEAGALKAHQKEYERIKASASAPALGVLSFDVRRALADGCRDSRLAVVAPASGKAVAGRLLAEVVSQ
jgi:phage gp46-like protein